MLRSLGVGHGADAGPDGTGGRGVLQAELPAGGGETDVDLDAVGLRAAFAFLEVEGARGLHLTAFLFSEAR